MEFMWPLHVFGCTCSLAAEAVTSPLFARVALHPTTCIPDRVCVALVSVPSQVRMQKRGLTIITDPPQVLQAMNGQEALQMMAEADALPDLILLDVMMPGMSGYEVSNHLNLGAVGVHGTWLRCGTSS